MLQFLLQYSRQASVHDHWSGAFFGRVRPVDHFGLIRGEERGEDTVMVERRLEKDRRNGNRRRSSENQAGPERRRETDRRSEMNRRAS